MTPYFEGAIDNASGMAVMVGLAEYFSKIPQAQRRRTLKFVTTSGHHAGSAGVNWMHDNRQTFFAKTAVAFNVEHVVGNADLHSWSGAAAVEQRLGAAVVGLRQQQAVVDRLERVPDIRRDRVSRDGRHMLRRQQRHSA